MHSAVVKEKYNCCLQLTLLLLIYRASSMVSAVWVRYRSLATEVSWTCVWLCSL